FEESHPSKIILHLLAIHVFHNTIIPKSSLFQESPVQQMQFDNAELAVLTTTEGQSDKYMVLEQQDNICICMIFDE
ncbi:hypothetical protein, partial [Psychromonas aquatilis]